MCTSTYSQYVGYVLHSRFLKVEYSNYTFHGRHLHNLETHQVYKWLTSTVDYYIDRHPDLQTHVLWSSLHVGKVQVLYCNRLDHNYKWCTSS